MKSFVVSKPAEDLRARLRVLMTSPDGRTTVCKKCVRFIMVLRTLRAKSTRLRNHSAFAVPYRTAFADLLLVNVVAKMLQVYLLPEQPVLIMPPMVAPGAGSSLHCKAQSRSTFTKAM